MYRMGQGIDFHRLVEGRPFWLGGILIDHPKGGLGHSDADVLIHAICDALLGALSLGDIGFHFPDTDPAYKDIDSKVLLRRCFGMMVEKGYRLVNLDATIMIQNPRIQPYREKMIRTLAEILEVEVGDLNIKATTTETMGFVGREEGVAASAVVLLAKI